MGEVNATVQVEGRIPDFQNGNGEARKVQLVNEEPGWISWGASGLWHAALWTGAEVADVPGKALGYTADVGSKAINTAGRAFARCEDGKCAGVWYNPYLRTGLSLAVGSTIAVAGYKIITGRKLWTYQLYQSSVGNRPGQWHFSIPEGKEWWRAAAGLGMLVGGSLMVIGTLTKHPQSYINYDWDGEVPMDRAHAAELRGKAELDELQATNRELELQVAKYTGVLKSYETCDQELVQCNTNLESAEAQINELDKRVTDCEPVREAWEQIGTNAVNQLGGACADSTGQDCVRHAISKAAVTPALRETIQKLQNGETV